MSTLFGFLLALGSAMTQAPGIRDNTTAHDVGGIIQTLSAIALGAVAADSNKTESRKKERL